MKEASFWEKRENSQVNCFLCRHHCLIPDGKRGICCVRENRSGTLYTLSTAIPVRGMSTHREETPFSFLPRLEGLLYCYSRV